MNFSIRNVLLVLNLIKNVRAAKKRTMSMRLLFERTRESQDDNPFRLWL